MTIRSALINVMVAAARRAARGLVRDYGEINQLQVSKKGPGDFVTAADSRAERVLFEELNRSRPGWSFLFEEQGRIEGKDSDHCWIINALDGTTNLLHGMPYFCISIAAERQKEMIAGVIYDPLRNEIFVSEKGSGAYMNDKRLRVSARKSINEALLATFIPDRGNKNHDKFLKQLQKIMIHTAGIRSQGASALDLAYVAAGRYEGFWNSGLQPWDIAAGMLIVREAGGIVTDEKGQSEILNNDTIVAANSELHAKILALL